MVRPNERAVLKLQAAIKAVPTRTRGKQITLWVNAGLRR